MRTEGRHCFASTRLMHRLDADSAAERAEVGWQVLRFRQTMPAAGFELTTPSSNVLVEHWRPAARDAVLAEHDTAPDRAVHLTAAQVRAVAGDVAAVSQALVVLGRRYRNTPGWESLAGCDRRGWAALVT